MFTAVVVDSSNIDLFWLGLEKRLVELFFARETSKSSVDIVLQRKTELATTQSLVIPITKPFDKWIQRKILFIVTGEHFLGNGDFIGRKNQI